MNQKVMRSIVLSLWVMIMSMSIYSCGDGNVVIQEDPAIQAAEDSATIVNYFSDLGLEGDTVQTTPSGVRFVILDRGSDPIIEDSDIVTYHYTGKLLNDTIFDTSIQEVADSIRVAVAADTVGRDDITEQLLFLSAFPTTRNHTSLTFTYSTNGWTLLSSTFINGFVEGIANSFNQMGAGGKALIVIPSGQAYGLRGSGNLIPPNTIIAFELFPIEVIEQ